MSTIFIALFFFLIFIIEGACIGFIAKEVWEVIKNVTNKHTVKMDKIGKLISIGALLYWGIQAYLRLEGYGQDADIILWGLWPLIGAVLVVFLKRYLRD